MERLPNTVMFTIATAGFVPFVHNLFASLEPLGLADHLTVFTLDDEAHSVLSAAGLNCRRSGSQRLAGWTDYLSSGYGQTMAFKYSIALDILTEGRKAWYVDADIVFLRDPTAYLQTLLHEFAADLLMQSESPKNVFNGGFWLATPAPAVVGAFTDTLAALQDPSLNDDQNYLNARLSQSPDLKVVGLDPDLFACGNRFNSSRYGPFDYSAAYLLHFNYIVGKKAKALAMARHNAVFYPGLLADCREPTGMLTRAWRRGFQRLGGRRSGR